MEDVHSVVVPLLVDAKDPNLAHLIGVSDKNVSLNPKEEDDYIAPHSTMAYKKIF